MAVGLKAVDKSVRLRENLSTSMYHDFEAHRPVLRHLNADSSWLLSLPYPHDRQPPSGRCRYNIVIDAWFQGPQVDFFNWFSSQEHAEPSAIKSFSQLNMFLQEVEMALTNSQAACTSGYIDAVCCSHEFTDHCHQATLTELSAHVPVFAPKKAASLIRSWKHFEYVTDIPMYAKGVFQVMLMLPEWISVARVHSRNDGPAYLHSAMTFRFILEADTLPELIVYTPHGIEARSLQDCIGKGDEFRFLALIHGLHDISLAGSQLNLGKNNALKIQQQFQVKYWSATHDEVKIAHGIVAFFLKRSAHTFEVAPGGHPITDIGDQTPRTSSDILVTIGNGASFVLL